MSCEKTIRSSVLEMNISYEKIMMSCSKTMFPITKTQMISCLKEIMSFEKTIRSSVFEMIISCEKTMMTCSNTIMSNRVKSQDNDFTYRGAR